MALTPEAEARKAELLKRKKIIELTTRRAKLSGTKMSYDEATKGGVAMELARSGVRGAGYAAEFFGDIGDIARASVDQWIPGLTPGETGDDKVWDQLNPFGAPDRGDISREQFVKDTGLAKLGEEKIRTGDSAALDFGKTALEYVVPTLTGGGAGTGRQLAKTVAATSLGAASGEALGNVTGNKYVGMAGELIGAVTGGGISRAVANKVKGLVSKFFPPEQLTDEVVENAVQAIMLQADDPSKAKATFLKAVEDNDAGTLADMMGDAGVFNVEATALKGSAAERAQVVAQTARDEQMVQRAGGVIGEGDTAAVQGLAQSRQAEGRARINQGRYAEQARAGQTAEEATTASTQRVGQAVDELTTAEQGLTKAREAALVTTPVSQQSKKLATTYNIADEARYKRDVQPLYDKLDDPNMPHVNTPQMDDFLESALKSLDKVDELPIRREFSDEIAAIKALGDTTHPKVMANIMSRIKQKGRDRTKDASNYQRQMDKMMSGFEALLVNTPVSGPTYRAAASAHKAHIERMRPAGLGKARTATKKEGELLGSKLAMDLESGALTAQQILASNSPAVIKTFKDTMRSMANRANKNGTLDSFLRKHEELLDAFPDVRDDLANLNRVQDDVEGLSKQVDNLVTQEVKVQEGIGTALTQARQQATTRATTSKGRLSARLVQELADQPNTTIDKVLRSENSVNDVNTLIKTVGRTPEGMQNLRKLITDRFMEGVTRSTDGVIDPSIVKDFKKVRGTLEDTGLMRADELKALDQVFDMTRATSLRKAAGRPTNEQMTRGQKLTTSAMAALSMKLLPGNSLIMAGAAKQWMKDQILKTPNPNIELALESMAKDPKRFAEAIRKYKPADEQSMRVMLGDMLKAAVQTGTGALVPPLMVESGNAEPLLYRE